MTEKGSQKITRCEKIEGAWMEPTISRTFYEAGSDQCHAWRCDACGLVWSERWHAEACADYGHKPSFQQGPYGCRMDPVTGRYSEGTYYTRRALRRERPSQGGGGA